MKVYALGAEQTLRGSRQRREPRRVLVLDPRCRRGSRVPACRRVLATTMRRSSTCPPRPSCGSARCSTSDRTRSESWRSRGQRGSRSCSPPGCCQKVQCGRLAASVCWLSTAACACLLGEKLVDEILSSEGISHAREVHYPGTNLRSDWTCGDTHVEFFGLTATWCTTRTRSQARARKKTGLRLIELYPADVADPTELRARLGATWPTRRAFPRDRAAGRRHSRRGAH